MKYSPDLETFRRLAGPGTIVPVFGEVIADELTPMGAYRRIATERRSFLLESVVSGEAIGRYSFVGAQPFMRICAKAGRVEIERGETTETSAAENPIPFLERELRRYRQAHVAGFPPFAIGAIGYFGYECTRFFEKLPEPKNDPFGLPDYSFMFFDRMLVFDHRNRTLKIIAAVRIDEPDADLDALYAQALERIDAQVEALKKPLAPELRPAVARGVPSIEPRSNMTRGEYVRAVKRIVEYINAGDIFQAVFSQRFEVRTAVPPLEVYRTLRSLNPSPYMFYLDDGEAVLVGSSPEVMVRIEGGEIEVRPIAGTRRRGADAAEDERLAAELLADPKECAEHIMLLDLGRNDVGRVSEPGSVRIAREMFIEKYSHVMHIVSSVVGKTKKGLSALDALGLCTPAGTLSGAPKIRAMEIINELEPDRRGPYGGALGVIDYAGNVNTCITIRTIVFRDGVAAVQAGGGIVADSDPDREFDETVNKARALFSAIGETERAYSGGRNGSCSD